jgi:hypothetical protein
MADLPVPAPDPLAPYLSEAESYARRSKAENTLNAYRSDWAAFEVFCQGRGVANLPASPATVAAYAADTARTLKANTVERRLTAISQAHQLAGCPNPVEGKLVRTVMAGIRRDKGTAQQGKDPLAPNILRRGGRLLRCTRCTPPRRPTRSTTPGGRDVGVAEPFLHFGNGRIC